MPQLPSDPARPWLDSLTVCAVADEADAVRRLLRERGLTTRAVPSGRARLAWTCVDGDRIHGLVVSGVGAEQARRSATFWMHRSRVLVVLGVTTGTGLTELPATVLEGSDWMLARARTAAAAGDPPLVLSHLAAAAPGRHTEEARRSLADAGIAATLPEVDVWRDAAPRFDAEALVVAGLLDPADLDVAALERTPVGAAGPGPVRTVLGVMRRADRTAIEAVGAARGVAATAAARCAVRATGIG